MPQNYRNQSLQFPNFRIEETLLQIGKILRKQNPNVNNSLGTSNRINSVTNSDDTISFECESVSTISISPLLDFSNLRGLKSANLNVNSLLKHIDEIRILLSDNPFDILAINESKVDYSRSTLPWRWCGYLCKKYYTILCENGSRP